jgi:glycosyltransferase involved in cell wall biosynthesis
MDSKPLLTIAIPTYNGGNTIQNLLDLLLPQCSDEIEVIISDNCSTDGTDMIIKKYKEKSCKIIYNRNDRNIGPDANFLKCMRMAKGDFTWLVSDDDIVTEDSVGNIISFLKKNKNVCLVYLTTRDFRGKYNGINECMCHKPEAEIDICTNDKEEFMKYAGYYWGFMSSFICNTSKFNEIPNPEIYYGTFWLQSYIHALCTLGNEIHLGVIKYPCVGAGIYVNTANYDSALVNGVYYKKLIDFMVKNAYFDEKQLNDLYIRRLCLLSRHDIIKEKAAGIKKINKKTLFKCTFKYFRAWITLYPVILIPKFMCSIGLRLYRNKKGLEGKVRINRPE